MNYRHTDIEKSAQAHWASTNAYKVLEHDARFPKGKFYACSMLPYPSGKLHMGHVRNYTINDVMYRYLRMQGYNVLMPMGWDAFGLPAENAAMKNRVAPAKWTYDNIAYMKQQMQSMGLAIDWSREITACKPDYYKWNQWLFLKMLDKGIAYRKTQVVNWDPVDMTVLANEQVIDGKGWRTGAVVEKREIPGYYLKITDYAPELLEHTLTHLPGWPERVRVMQENWIGRSEGVRFYFKHSIKNAAGELIQDGKLHVFTTRADTIMGVTFCAVAAEHPLASHAGLSNAKLAAFIEECKKGGVAEADMATAEKVGMNTGLTVTHPLTGAEVPLWVANYVLMSYGDGAVMAVPGHDERDFAFANKYALPIKQVVTVAGQGAYDSKHYQEWYADKVGGKCMDSGVLDGLGYADAVNKVVDLLGTQGEKKTTFRLRDWGISRQRYWGTPIPIIHCDDCGAVPVPEQDLPVVLPEDCVPDGSGNPLNKREDFLKCLCPKCGKAARRETDTMDTFIDSSWYFMRYCNPDNATAMVDARNDYWMPMDQYIGGIEHAILHLLYARYWTKVMRDLGLVKFDEPFTKLLTQGMVIAETYYRDTPSGMKEWFNPADVEQHFDAAGKPSHAVLKSDGQPVIHGGTEKMAKSKNNGVDPQAIIDLYGADTARHFVMRASHPEQTLMWSDDSVAGSYRFVSKLYDFALKIKDKVALGAGHAPLNNEARRTLHLTLKKANADYERIQYNTVVSAGDIILNSLTTLKNDADAANLHEGMSILLRVLYPVIPHVTYALWQELGYAALHGDLLNAPWPAVDESALAQDTLTLPLQVNGKLRGELTFAATLSNVEVEALAKASDVVAKWGEGRPVKMAKYVPGRLITVAV